VREPWTGKGVEKKKAPYELRVSLRGGKKNFTKNDGKRWEKTVLEKLLLW